MKKVGFMIVIVLVAFVSGFFVSDMGEMNMEDSREEFISLKENIMSDQMAEGNYRCCLKKPCTYCIEKTPGHGEGAACDCLSDIMNGVHPCGECIGEIMEGHGNKFLSKYFAKAIAEEVGEQHISNLREIMLEKYDIPIGEQE